MIWILSIWRYIQKLTEIIVVLSICQVVSTINMELEKKVSLRKQLNTYPEINSEIYRADESVMQPISIC